MQAIQRLISQTSKSLFSTTNTTRISLENACAQCAAPCSTPFPVEDIDTTAKLEGSTKDYQRHWIIMLHGKRKADQWSPAEQPDVFGLIKKYKETNKEQNISNEKVPIIHLCDTILGDSKATREDQIDLLTFPEYKLYKDINDRTFQNLLDGNPETGVDIKQDLGIDKFVFICGHMQKDKRCGVAGPILKQEFEDKLKVDGLDSSVRVALVSHVGGHKYAGNVILYPQGHWYGRVRPEHVPALIKSSLQEGLIIEDLYRGGMVRSAESW